MEQAAFQHEEELKRIFLSLEGEVEHIMVQGGCNQKCVSNMRDEGMLDDPSYVAFECNCADRWVSFDAKAIQLAPTDLDATPAAKTDGAKAADDKDAKAGDSKTDDTKKTTDDSKDKTDNSKTVATPKTPVAAPSSGAIHLTEFTCTCIIIFAV